MASKKTFRYITESKLEYKEFLSLLPAYEFSGEITLDAARLTAIITADADRFDMISEVIKANALGIETVAEPVYNNFDEILADDDASRESLRMALSIVLGKAAATQTEKEAHGDNLIKQIAKLTDRKEFLEKDNDQLWKLYCESKDKYDRVKKQIASIAVLVEAIAQ